MTSIYDFTVNDITDKSISLATFRGKSLLIINTVSQCGFTKQYDGLETIYQSYQTKGLEILAFPCNQFGKQEPGTNDEILSFCQTRYHVSFPVFAKLDVKGPTAHPLFQYLCQEKPGLLNSKTIKWNFTKFFVTKEGKVLKRFAPKDTPETVIKHISTFF
jgi:glutathione peroxidase